MFPVPFLGGSQLSITLASGDMTLFLASAGNCTYVGSMHVHAHAYVCTYTHTHTSGDRDRETEREIETHIK